MCRAPLPPEVASKTCEHCGADLSRWLPKPPRPTLDVEASVVSTGAPAAELAEPSIERGVLGAAVGAFAGTAVMYGFYLATSFRFPLLGVGTGILTGLLAKKFNRGGDEKLGMIAAVVATLSVVGSLYLIYGSSMTQTEILVLNCISLAVSARVAYRLAAR